MPLFHTILFPTDLSLPSRAIAAEVRKMAQRCDADVIVMHSFNSIPLYYLTGHMEAMQENRSAPVPYAPWAIEQRKNVQARVESFVQECLEGIRSTIVIEDGEPARMIECVAARSNADLIMMSTRGHGAFRRLLLGSITAKVLHDAGCPVFTSAHEPEARTGSTGFRAILCGLEWNEEAESILRLTYNLAQLWGSRISILHLTDSHDADGSAREAEFERLARKIGLDSPIQVLSESVPDGIRAAALAESAELVVVGRGKARADISRFWSDLYRIIRESPCPVISV